VITLSGEIIANIIDEVPILAVLATQVSGRIELRDARELRVKESDRIRTIVDGIRSMGGDIEEFDDGFAISGPQRLTGGIVQSAGDHRIAMAFAIGGLMADGTTEIRDADCASVSFPGFYQTLASVTEPGAVELQVTMKSRDARLAINEGDPIFLAGFMGAGKTAAGRALAGLLAYSFLDLDALIEERAGKSVREIFTQLGEQEFRRLEGEAIRSLDELKFSVVALGGGAYQSEPNRAALRTIGVTVWLDCPFEVCFERIKGGSSRPLLAGESELRELFDSRRAAYSAADYVVETGSLPPEKVAAQIIEKRSA